jgi:hypothetical protein
MAASGLRVASLRRRLAAGLIDAVLVVAPTVAIIGGGYVLYERQVRRRGPEDVTPPTREQLRHWRWVALAGSLPLAVVGRNWRSPGCRVLKLRMIDARTGGPVTVRGALIRWGVATAVRSVNEQAADAWRRRDPDVRPARARLPMLIPAVALRLPALWSPAGQTVYERLAGTVVVVED